MGGVVVPPHVSNPFIHAPNVKIGQISFRTRQPLQPQGIKAIFSSYLVFYYRSPSF